MSRGSCEGLPGAAPVGGHGGDEKGGERREVSMQPVPTLLRCAAPTSPHACNLPPAGG